MTETNFRLAPGRLPLDTSLRIWNVRRTIIVTYKAYMEHHLHSLGLWGIFKLPHLHGF